MKYKTLTLLAIAAVAAFASSASAAVVISFNGTTANASSTNNVFASIPIGSGTGIKTASIAYSPTTAWTPSGTYTGQSVYGGLYFEVDRSANNTTVMNASVYRGTDSPETFRFAAVNPGSANTSFLFNTALLFAPSVSDNYTFGSSSVLSVTQVLPNTVDYRDARWLVVASGTTYVSSASFTLNTTSTTQTLSNPDEINWAAWTPGTTLALGSLTYDTLGSTLTNITRAGLYTTFGMATASGIPTLDISAFSADLAIIPEPSSVAMLAVALGSLVILRRRSRA